jgi:hypothetical protein
LPDIRNANNGGIFTPVKQCLGKWMWRGIA